MIHSYKRIKIMFSNRVVEVWRGIMCFRRSLLLFLLYILFSFFCLGMSHDVNKSEGKHCNVLTNGSIMTKILLLARQANGRNRRQKRLCKSGRIIWSGDKFYWMSMAQKIQHCLKMGASRNQITIFR